MSATAQTRAPGNHPSRRAVIDIGTNSVKLLVADIQGNEVFPLLECGEQTRLGRGFYTSHRLLPSAIDHTCRVVEDYQQRAAQYGIRVLRIVATSAVREAKNQWDLTSRIEQTARFPVEVLSGDQEADLAFRGITTDPRLADRPLLVLDVGGGSTQIMAYPHGTGEIFRHSFRLGVVRLLDEMHLADPPQPEQLRQCLEQLRDFLTGHVQPILATEWITRHHGNNRLVGVGGTSTVLACIHRQLTTFDRSAIETTCLELQQVEQQMHRLWGLALSERRLVTGLPSNKADVILAGVAIYVSLMRHFGFKQLYPSTRGLRFGALLVPRDNYS